MNSYTNHRVQRIIFLVLLSLISACEGASFGAREKGALGGAAIGAGLGAIIGNQTGDSGAGIAIGSAIGALSGGLIGNQIDANDRAMDDADQRLAQQERELQENRRILEELRSRGADVRKTDRGIVVNLPDVLFEFGKSNLTPSARDTVKEIAEVVRSHSERRISVEGHTDSIGTVDYNIRLSENRARSVADELAYSGIPRKRIGTVGYGKSDPIASNKTEAGRRRNRRVEVVILNN